MGKGKKMESSSITLKFLQLGRYYMAREIARETGECLYWWIGKDGNYRNGFERREIYNFWHRN